MGKPVGLVSTKKFDSIEKSVSQALHLINFSLAKKPVKTVVIKPNLCYYWAPSTGNTTDPLVVAGIIDYLRTNYGNDLDIKVAEADATAMKTRHVFPMLGYTILAEEKNVELVNLSEADSDEIEVNVLDQKLTFKVAKLLREADLFINVPKFKTMREVTITCAFKNLFGCIGRPRKSTYHRHLEEAIVGINKILKPNLTIVDGLVGLGATPVRLDLIAASEDTFSVDWVAAKIMGYNPQKIRYLKIALKEHVGETQGVTVSGESVEQYTKMFPKVEIFREKLSMSLQLRLLKLYTRVVGDTVPSELDEG